MPTRKLKPDTPSRRNMSISTFEEITKKSPERKLTTALRKTGGRTIMDILLPGIVVGGIGGAIGLLILSEINMI